MTVESAVVMCSTCGWRREITRSEAFLNDPGRSANQAARGHTSKGECEYDDITVDVIHG